jgi:hypothetical protein
MVGESTVPEEGPPAEASDARERASTPGDCHGEPTPATTRELTARAAYVRRCYEELLHRDRGREGRIVIGLRVGRTGVIQRAGLILDELGDPDFETCVIERISLPLRSPPRGGCLDAEIPIRFAPKDG